MKILILTNLFPPQELGGYGRCISDFSCGLLQLGHTVTVLTSDAPYLQGHQAYNCDSNTNLATSVHRKLKLKGTYENGVNLIKESSLTESIDSFNRSVLIDLLYKGCDVGLVGNIDMIGPHLFDIFFSLGIPVFHHMGFMEPPYDPLLIPSTSLYYPLCASHAVFNNFRKRGFLLSKKIVVYPGARTDLFGSSVRPLSSSLMYAISKSNSGVPIGSHSNPLKVGFAGLIMSSKGPHTILEALMILRNQGFYVQAFFAGAPFQSDYYSALLRYIHQHSLTDSVFFNGQLNRSRLARFWDLQHVGIFSSIFPEAFGIVAAEILASGLALITTGVGGASELIGQSAYGKYFLPNDPQSLAAALRDLILNPARLRQMAVDGQKHVRDAFDVSVSVNQLACLFQTACRQL